MDAVFLSSRHLFLPPLSYLNQNSFITYFSRQVSSEGSEHTTKRFVFCGVITLHRQRHVEFVQYQGFASSTSLANVYGNKSYCCCSSSCYCRRCSCSCCSCCLLYSDNVQFFICERAVSDKKGVTIACTSALRYG